MDVRSYSERAAQVFVPFRIKPFRQPPISSCRVLGVRSERPPWQTHHTHTQNIIDLLYPFQSPRVRRSRSASILRYRCWFRSSRTLRRLLEAAVSALHVTLFRHLDASSFLYLRGYWAQRLCYLYWCFPRRNSTLLSNCFTII